MFMNLILYIIYQTLMAERTFFQPHIFYFFPTPKNYFFQKQFNLFLANILTLLNNSFQKKLQTFKKL